uniref:Uncharacterized protein n=1 Tax=viral metagenome TaxID=1070528 RepID=A0A6H1ZQ19_9ZZZZ
MKEHPIDRMRASEQSWLDGQQEFLNAALSVLEGLRALIPNTEEVVIRLARQRIYMTVPWDLFNDPDFLLALNSVADTENAPDLNSGGNLERVFYLPDYWTIRVTLVDTRAHCNILERERVETEVRRHVEYEMESLCPGLRGIT